jgi:endonuclease/exonuclease/phosphatase (EEP) superfamily protein YafD
MKNFFLYFQILSLLVLPNVFFIIVAFPSNFEVEIFLSFLPYLTLVFGSLFLLSVGIYFFAKRRKIIIVLLVVNFLIIANYSFKLSSFYSTKQVATSEQISQKKKLKLFVANVHWQNDRYDAMQDAISREDPDVVVLIEFTDLHYSNLKTFLNQHFPYSNLQTYEANLPYAGNMIFSRYPLENLENELMNGYYSGFAKADVLVEGEVFSVYAVHTTAPMKSEWFVKRNDQLEKIAQSVNSTKDDKIIVAGDFNLTPWSNYYETFDTQIKSRLKNATREQSPTYTWKHHKFPLISKMHIDHVFVSNSLGVGEVVTKDFEGSDHRGVSVEVLF